MQNAGVTSSLYDQLMLTMAISAGSASIAGPLHSVDMILFTSAPPITPTLTQADLTEASYPGYSSADSITFNTPLLQADGTYDTISTSVQFAVGATTATVDQTITGCALVPHGDEVNTLAVALFNPPVALTEPGQGFQVVLTINQGAEDPGVEVNVIQ